MDLLPAMDGPVVAWSGGKDCSLALHELRGAGVEVAELLTTYRGSTDRSAMHGVRRVLHQHQAEALGLSCNLVGLPPEPSMDAYDRAMVRELRRYRRRGVRRLVYGDCFLEDVRADREDRLAEAGVEGCWPLWGRDTAALARRFVDLGFRAVVVAVDGARFDEAWAGRPFDDRFLDELPPGVDPCGERGAFHTFVWDGPLFEAPVEVSVGETVTRPVGDGTYHYADLLPADDR